MQKLLMIVGCTTADFLLCIYTGLPNFSWIGCHIGGYVSQKVIYGA